MPQIKIQAPDGKVLLADLPQGVDPAQAAEEISRHYMSTTPSEAGVNAERSPDYPHTGITELGPSVDVAGVVAGATGAAKAGLGAGATLAKGAGKLFAPSVESAETALMPALEKAGLKDIPPVIFNPGERQAAIDYAQSAAKNAGNLPPAKLQEARATLKDVLDNLIKPNSPSGQIVSQAKDAVTSALKDASQRALESPIPDTEGLGAVGPGLENLAAAYQAQPVKSAVQKALTGAIPFGLGYAARNALRIPKILYGAGQEAGQ